MNYASRYINLESISLGLAMFSMFFGAGNVIFPLALGQLAGEQNGIAVLGLIITAVLVPFAGVFAMILFDGEQRKFFDRLGALPGFLVALSIISLLGPLGSTPRCIALTYATLNASFPELPLFFFSVCFCLIVFLFAFRKNRMLTLLGWVLTPLLLGSLLAIVLIGLFTDSASTMAAPQPLAMFIHGLKEGYNTMDLLAAFFFSSTIITILKERSNEKIPHSDNISSKKKCYIKLSLQASAIGASLLALIYFGFSFISAFHGADLVVSGKEELLNAIILKIAGPSAGLLVIAAVTLACLTTAIALISAFADFIQREVFNERVSYPLVLLGSLLLTLFISTFKFTGISAFLGPILQIYYPSLILLTLLNIAYKLYDFKPIKGPVFVTLVLSALIYGF